MSPTRRLLALAPALTLVLPTAAQETDPRATAQPRATLASRLEFVGVAVAEPGYHVWGSSPITGPEDRTHLFVARWPIEAKFDPGWRTHSEIAHYVGDRPEGPFTFVDVALRGTGEDTWDRCGAHNPAIHRVGERYALLYVANDGLERHPRNQRIGMAVADSLDGPWKRVGADGMVLGPPPDRSYFHFEAGNGVVNPALLQHPDGRLFLYFKSNDTRGERRGWRPRMGLAVAAGLEGPYLPRREPVTANDRVIEDGYAFLRGDGDGDRVCLLTTDNHGILERGGGLLWESPDGLRFEEPAPGFHRLAAYLEDGRLPDGARTHYGEGGKFERPQLLVRDGVPTHLYVPSGTNIDGGSGTVSYVLRVRRGGEGPGE